jgi:predicted ester cyclase
MELSTLKSAAAAVLLCGLAACSAPSNPEADKMLADHKAMLAADSSDKAMNTAREEGVRAVFAMFETGKSDGIEKYCAESMVEHTPPPGTNPQGIQGLKDMIAMHHGAFPDSKITIHTITHGGDIMMIHYNMKGTFTGDMGPEMKGTGKTMDVDGVDIIKFSGDKATDHWGYMEEMKMMTQVGLMPDPAAAPEKK